MVLNALDDMVSVKDNIRIDLAEQHPGFVLLLTRFGSHVAFERDLTSFDSSLSMCTRLMKLFLRQMF